MLYQCGNFDAPLIQLVKPRLNNQTLSSNIMFVTQNIQSSNGPTVFGQTLDKASTHNSSCTLQLKLLYEVSGCEVTQNSASDWLPFPARNYFVGQKWINDRKWKATSMQHWEKRLNGKTCSCALPKQSWVEMFDRLIKIVNVGSYSDLVNLIFSSWFLGGNCFKLDLFILLGWYWCACFCLCCVCCLLSVFWPQYCNLFDVNWLPCFFTLKLFLEANTLFLFHCTFYVISAVVLCRGRIKSCCCCCLTGALDVSL